MHTNVATALLEQIKVCCHFILRERVLCFYSLQARMLDLYFETEERLMSRTTLVSATHETQNRFL